MTIVSVSNKFISFDVVTSDLARQVYPALEKLMVDLELSQDNKFAMVNGTREMIFQHNTSPLLMMSLSVNGQWTIGTRMRGFRLWSVDGRQAKYFLLPHSFRNVKKKP